MPIAKKIQKADILLENGGTVEELKEKLSNLIKNFWNGKKHCHTIHRILRGKSKIRNLLGG